MHERFLPLLQCLSCHGELTIQADLSEQGRVLEGSLVCSSCSASHPIRRGIPRFVPPENYAGSFGFQWNKFPRINRDSYNGTTLNRDTILRRTGWGPNHLSDKTLVECGCGAGCDTEVLADLAQTLVTVDLSHAVDAIPPEVAQRDNVLLLQADLGRLPLRPAAFDVVYCHRVLQHTPDPEHYFHKMAPHVKPGGEFFVHIYDAHLKSLLAAKYWLRPLTRRMRPETVLRVLQTVGPFLYRMLGVLEPLHIRRLLKLLVPFDNHRSRLRAAGSRLTPEEEYHLSLLITFDALTPAYDQPHSPKDVLGWFHEAGYDDCQVIQRNPVCIIGRRPAESVTPRVVGWSESSPPSSGEEDVLTGLSPLASAAELPRSRRAA